MDIQLKRGSLDVCVLAALLSEDSYGYKIIQSLQGVIEISESTLYPILKRLEASGQVTVYSVEHNGRLRKYYRITDAGRRRIAEFLEEWRALMTMYRRIEAQADGIPRAAHTGNEGKEGNEV
jgi:PadR family transcriptional regulator PadR